MVTALGVQTFTNENIVVLDNDTSVWMYRQFFEHGGRFKIIAVIGYVHNDIHYRSIIYKV